ncbi:MAG: helix-turn-helix domain-containing protein [Bacillota bacterium]|jgi:hypothetical protein
MEQVLDGKLTIKLAAELLGLSERQVKRLKKGMKEKGVRPSCMATEAAHPNTPYLRISEIWSLR